MIDCFNLHVHSCSTCYRKICSASVNGRRDVYNLYKVYIYLSMIWWVIAMWSKDLHTRTHFAFIRRAYLSLQRKFVTSHPPWLCGQTCTELHGRVKSLCLPISWRADQSNIKTQLHDFLLMDEQVLFTHLLSRQQFRPALHFHHWPSTSSYHSSQLQ